MAKQTSPFSFVAAYPNLARWIAEQGWIEIGRNGFNTSLVRALDPGGTTWESSDQPSDVDEALRALDADLAAWFEENEE
jgi:hypothetical protein